MKLSAASQADLQWVIVMLEHHPFALPVKRVLELACTPQVERMPDTPAWIRGIINLRGQVMPLIDLRARLGMLSAMREIDDFCGLMEQREQDHRRWIAELEASVREKRSFTLATDPNLCAFGRWYNTYKPDNHLVARLLKRFDAPHRAIHATADRVLSRAATGDHDGAIAIVDETRHTQLNAMIELFGQLRQLYRETHREIAVVLEDAAGRFAVSVDGVESIERLPADSFELLTATVPGLNANAMARTAARRTKDNTLALLLEVDLLREPTVS